MNNYNYKGLSKLEEDVFNVAPFNVLNLKKGLSASINVYLSPEDMELIQSDLKKIAFNTDNDSTITHLLGPNGVEIILNVRFKNT